MLTNYVIIFHLILGLLLLIIHIVRICVSIYVYHAVACWSLPACQILRRQSFPGFASAQCIKSFVFSISMDAETVIDAPLLDIYVLFFYIISLCSIVWAWFWRFPFDIFVYLLYLYHPYLCSIYCCSIVVAFIQFSRSIVVIKLQNSMWEDI